MKRRKVRGGVFLSLALVIFYIIFFPVSLGRELLPNPVWAVSLRSYPKPYRHPSEQRVYPFRLGQDFGYIGVDGELTLLDSVVYSVAMSDKGFVNFSQVPASLILQNREGDPVLSIQEHGYPTLDSFGERMFIFYTDTTGLKELTLDGKELWRAQFPSLITCFSHSNLMRLIGLTNGKLLLFSENGEKLLETTPSESRIPIVLGCALSPTGNGIAAVAGLAPQNLVYLRAKAGQYEEGFTVSLSSSFRREVFIRFSHDGNRLFLEQPDGLGILEIPSGEMASVPIGGRLVDLADVPERSAVVVITEHTRREVGAYTYQGHPIFSETLPCPESTVLSAGGGFILGSCSRLMRVDIEED